MNTFIKFNFFHFLVFYNFKKPEKNFPDDYIIDENCVLIHKTTKKPYTGDSPYIIISINGKESKSLKKFEASLATADMLNQYFGETTHKEAVEQILNGATLCTDLYYRNKIDELDQQIKNPDTSAEEKLKIIEERAAYLKNIINDVMK